MPIHVYICCLSNFAILGYVENVFWVIIFFDLFDNTLDFEILENVSNVDLYMEFVVPNLWNVDLYYMFRRVHVIAET